MIKRKFVIIAIFCMSLLVGCGDKAPIEEETEEITTEATTKELTEYQISEEITTEEPTEEALVEEVVVEKKMLIAIDPGHQGPSVDMSATEPNAPGSSEMKRKATEGTTGKFTGVGEYQLNLDISLQLREALIKEGYDVVMTRENNETAISNAERATLANEAGADFSIRIHANGSDDSGTNGALAMTSTASNPYVGDQYEESKKLGQLVLDHYCEATGMKNLGIQETDTMTGINWSQIPVMILEMGFMSNQADDTNMQDADYQKKMVQGIVDGINAYAATKKTNSDEASETDNSSAIKSRLEQLVQSDKISNAKAAMYVMDIQKTEDCEVGSVPMKSASLIKLFIAGCVSENKDKIQGDDVDSLMRKMISNSDNDATNTLVKRLGNGNAEDGIARVNVYCERHGFTDTSMGRLMLDFSAALDNYTSVKDCGKFLNMVYHDELPGSRDILEYLKNQERRTKIPAGIPNGTTIANKTGELDDVENDVAIVYGDKRDYIVCVMLNDLSNTEAGREWIVDASTDIYNYFSE